MQIVVSEFSRDDGLTMVRQPSSNWVIRKIAGPAWFYSNREGCWIVVTRISNLEAYAIPFEIAWKIFQTVSG